MQSVTGELPFAILVMICDEKSAGRIVVELDPLVRFNLRMDRQLARLEARMKELVPQLARRGTLGQAARGALGDGRQD